MSGRRAPDASGGADSSRAPITQSSRTASPENRATTSFQNFEAEKRKEEAFRAKLASAERDLAAAREHARIKSMAPGLRGSKMSSIFTYTDQQIILPGAIQVAMVKNAVWSAFGSELNGTTPAEYDLCVTNNIRLLQEDAELKDAHAMCAEAYRAWRPLKLYLYEIDDERRKKLDDQRREEAALREQAAFRRRRAEDNERKRIEEEQRLYASNNPPAPAPRPASPGRAQVPPIVMDEAHRPSSRTLSPGGERPASPRGKLVRSDEIHQDDSASASKPQGSPREEPATLSPPRNMTPQPCKYGDRCQDMSKDHRSRYAHAMIITNPSNPIAQPAPLGTSTVSLSTSTLAAPAPQPASEPGSAEEIARAAGGSTI